MNQVQSLQRTQRFEVDNYRYVVAKINKLCFESLESSTIRFVSVVAAKCLPNFLWTIVLCQILEVSDQTDTALV